MKFLEKFGRCEVIKDSKTDKISIKINTISDIDTLYALLKKQMPVINQLIKTYDRLILYNNYVVVYKGNLCGLCDYSIYVIFPIRFREILVSEEFGIAEVRGYKKGIYSLAKRCFLTHLIFEEADICETGVITVRENGFWGLLDKSGNVILPIVYDNIWVGIKRHVYYIVQKLDGYAVFYPKDGELKSEFFVNKWLVDEFIDENFY